MIQPEQLYTTGQVVKLDPILMKKGYQWVYKQVKFTKRLPAINTSSTKVARFLVRGSDVIELLKEFKVEN